MTQSDFDRGREQGIRDALDVVKTEVRALSDDKNAGANVPNITDRLIQAQHIYLIVKKLLPKKGKSK
jgi:hypothetical protein